MRRLREILDAVHHPATALDDVAQSAPSRAGELTPEQMAAVSFILTIGRALHVYGSPAHRLEDALTRISNRIGVRGQFFSTPTSLFAAFGEDAQQRTYLVRVDPGEVNLEKLCLLDDVLERVARGEINAPMAIEMVRVIVDAPRRYGSALTTICFAVAPVGATIFFGGSWREMIVAGLAGLLIGLLSLMLRNVHRARPLFEILAGFTAAATAIIGAAYFGPLSAHTATLAGVIMLLPGLSLTVAINELATRNLASGTARLMGALTILMSLGFGVAIGFGLMELLPVQSPLAPSQSASIWILIATVFVTAASLTVLFQARVKDMPFIAGAALLAFFGSRYGSAQFGPYLGVALGSFAVAVASNLLARWRNQPSAVTMLPGLILLVPGSLGFRSLQSLLDHDVVTAVEGGFSMLMIAVSIVAGVFVAAAVVPPRKAL